MLYVTYCILRVTLSDESSFPLVCIFQTKPRNVTKLFYPLLRVVYVRPDSNRFIQDQPWEST